MIKVGIPKEIDPSETRVAAHPDTVSKMVKGGMQVFVETGAGEKSFLSDDDYKNAGAQIVNGSVFEMANTIFKVNPPSAHEVNMMQEEAIYIGPLYPSRNREAIQACIAKKITAFALELLPRIARTQSMDILSSMSNLAGYKSVILAADYLTKIFPMLTTAAGTIQPVKVIVIGAGVAGLQAIATARRLGGVVIGFDTRPITEEQVKSLGADFVSMAVQHEEAQDAGGYAKEQSQSFYQQEQEIIHKYSQQTDVIITTALIPGKPAPLLITEKMVAEMKPGSIIVDLAAEQGGNCELTEAGKIVIKHHVTIIGLTNLPSLVPMNASLLFSRNLLAFLNYLAPQLSNLDLNDEVIKGCLATYKGDVVHPLIKTLIQKDASHAN